MSATLEPTSVRRSPEFELFFPVTISRIESKVGSEYPERALIQISLLEDDVLAHDQAVSGHLFQRGQDAAHVLVGVDEGDDHWQLAYDVDEVRSLDAVAP